MLRLKPGGMLDTVGSYAVFLFSEERPIPVVVTDSDRGPRPAHALPRLSAVTVVTPRNLRFGTFERP